MGKKLRELWKTRDKEAGDNNYLRTAIAVASVILAVLCVPVSLAQTSKPWEKLSN